ncbi:DSBA oxidoreductase [Roseiflexus castenholzii DSM 13941]|uniref:DSBA oxidoreductase n=1 Tax=Roseiflexus castenholzii (strain DSM 13941 / HLO8) TaxID=383372 RepID=A7NJT3_ROSCS|nr:DSBA oxidoreductase [Roseiflexus castenholzii DSM 13941]
MLSTKGIHRVIKQHQVLPLAIILPIIIAACGGTPSAAPTPPQSAPIVSTAPSATQVSAVATPASDTPAATTEAAGLERGRTPEGYHYLGNADAPVTILEFSDFLCTACAFHVEETEPAIIDAYVATGKARIVYRHLLQLGEESLRAAEAAECAGDQGKFWEMRDAIYRNQAALYTTGDVGAALTYLAQTIDLDMNEYNVCVQSRKHRARIEADFRAAQDAGIRSRPVFDIGGTRLVGARPFEDFQAILDQQ